MKKAVIIIVFTLLITGVFVQPEYSHAVDTTLPILKGLVFEDPDNIREGEYFTIEIDVEDASGIAYIDLMLTNEAGDHFHMYPMYATPRIYSGKTALQYKIQTAKSGTYKVKWVTLEDGNGNVAEYDEAALEELGIDQELNITGTGGNKPLPGIRSLIVRNPNAVDAKGDLTIDMDITDAAIWGGDLDFEDATGRVTRLTFYFEESAIGKTTVRIPIRDQLPDGINTLRAIWLDFGNAFCYSSEKDCYYREKNDSTEWLTGADITCRINVINSAADTVAPVINSVDIKTKDMVLPTVFKVEVDITEEGGGINEFLLYFKNANGHEICTPSYLPNDIYKKRTGKHTLKIPFSPFTGEGTYTLEKIIVGDFNRNGSDYVGTELDRICSDRTMSLRSPFVVSYEGPLGNTGGVQTAVKNMNEGETAVLDARHSTIIPKALFESIAGKDITLVFTTEDVEWIFNGKDIIKSRCKDIDIATSFSLLKGKVWGFADDKKVLAINFRNNGKLPGKARIRINNEYISAKYAGGSKHLVLTYVSEKKMTVEDTKAPIENDEAAVITIDHNSRFILSGGLLSLNNAKVIAHNCVYSGALKKPGVTVKLNGRKIDSKCYKKKYSNNRAVGTASATATGNQAFGYKGKATGHFYINPKKAVISKAVAGKKKITVRMKAKPSQLGATWYKVQYRIAGKSKWKSAKTSGKTKVIKNLKKGKRYQVRVRAYKGKYRKGAVSSIKKTQAVK